MSLKNNLNINVSRYVALGDSITSGYTDGALFFEGQLDSYANLLAQQFKLIGGGEFKQPLMNKDSVGVGFYGNARMTLPSSKNESPKYIAPIGDLAVFSENCNSSQGPFNDMSVPSAKLTSLVTPGIGNPANGAGNFNPFFTRMASNPYSSSILSDAIAQDPTFFSLFIGNNDILTYASSGATMDFITPLEGEVGKGFIKSLEEIINALTKNGAKGIIANLADIINVPYFTVIPFDGLIANAEQALYLSVLYKEHGLSFHEGKNPFIITNHDGSIRQIKSGELIILDVQLDPNKLEYLTGLKPIPKKYILALDEIEKIENALSSYNIEIERIAHKNHLALVDVNAFTKTLRQEIHYDSSSHCAIYNSNTVFSLDGLHLNSYGQAMLANIFIKTINAIYHTKIGLVDVLKYKKI